VSVTRALAIVSLILASAGLIWTAAIQWQSLTDRVTAIEKENVYMRGHIDVPGAK